MSVFIHSKRFTFAFTIRLREAKVLLSFSLSAKLASIYAHHVFSFSRMTKYRLLHTEYNNNNNDNNNNSNTTVQHHHQKPQCTTEVSLQLLQPLAKNII